MGAWGRARRGASLPVPTAANIRPHTIECVLGGLVAQEESSRVSAVTPPGRSSVLALIAAAFDGAERGEGRAIIVSGPSGIGKSTVLQAAVQRAKTHGFRVLEARATPRDTPVPFDLVRELVAKDIAEDSAPGGASSAMGLPLWLVQGDQPGVVSGFPTIAVLPEGDTPVEKRILTLFQVERSMIDLGRRALHAQLERAIAGDPSGGPVMVAVDDLHHTDRDSLGFLKSLAGDLRERRLILVATLGSEASVTGSQRALIDSLTAGPNVEVVQLSGLSLDETAGVIRSTRPEPRPSPEYVQAIHQRSKGIPAVIEQLTRRYREAIPAPEKAGEEGGLPAEPAFRLGSVPEETVRILTYGSVVGRQFDLAVMARTLHRRSAEVLAPLIAPLVDNGLLRHVSGQRYEFSTATLREELYSKLPEGRRRLMHRNVARALEIGARRAGPELFEIAYHYHLAAETVPSVDYNRRAADLATRQYAYEDARVYLERALDSLWQLPSSRPESERVVRIALAHVLTRIDKVAEAIQILEPLRDPTQSGPLGPSPLQQLFAPEIRQDLWDHAEKARSAAERSLRAYQAKGELRWLAVAHRALGVAAWSLADPTQAEEHHQAAAQLARLAGDAQLEGQSLLDRAHLVRLLDPNGLALSRRLLTEAIERFTASGDAEWLARAYLDRSTVLRALGRLPDALADLTQASEKARSSGSQTLEIWVELRTARVLVEEGRTGRARKSIDRLRQLAGDSPRREVQQQIAFISGLLQEREGRADRARPLFEESLALAAEAGALEEAADSHRRLAELDERAGKAEDARRHREEAERLASRVAASASGRGAG
jgi:tetratricopeptide (TPR) repeat protein